MGLFCPRCETPFRRPETLWFLWMQVVQCRHCDAPLVLDGTGRLMLWLSLLAALAVAIFTPGLGLSRIVAVVVAISGFVAAILNANRFGTLRELPGDD